MPRLSSNPPDHVAENLNRICGYLAEDDFHQRPLSAEEIFERTSGEGFDLVAVFGNQLLPTLVEACRLVQSGLAPLLLLSGGKGHSTPFLFASILQSERLGPLVKQGALQEDWAEANMFAAIARLAFKIPRDKILIEDQSANTGENAQFSLDLLARQNHNPRRVLLLQDPLMQRRTMLTVSRKLQTSKQSPKLFSHSVFVPEVIADSNGHLQVKRNGPEQLWDADRLVQLALGEIRRLRNDESGYGPRGRNFIPAVEIPTEILSAYASVVAAMGSNNRER